MHNPAVDAHQSGRLALFGQSFAPIHNSTLGFELMAPMARMLGWHGLLKPLARDEPSNQNHRRLTRHDSRILSDPLGGSPLLRFRGAPAQRFFMSAS